MVKSAICDKCNRPITKEVTELEFKNKKYDLCWECRDALKKFLSTKPNALSKFIG